MITIKATGDTTLHTAGKYCEEDILVQVPEAGGEKVDYSENEDAMVAGTLTSYYNDRVKSIRHFAFYECTNLTSVSFPVCTTIGNYAIYGCTNLTSVSFPVCTTIGNYVFYGCTNLTSVSFPVCTSIGLYAFRTCKSLTSASFPACTSIGNYAFQYCSSLTSLSFPACTSIGNYAFQYCYRLSGLYLLASSVCQLSASNAFQSTPFDGYSTYFSGTPYIYVPASLVEAYKTATNWTYFANRIFPIE